MSFDELADGLRAYSAADVKAGRKLARTLAHQALGLAERGNLAEQEIDLLLAALQAGARVHSYPQRYLTAQAELLARRRKITGAADPEVTGESVRTIDVEMGALALFDAEAGLPEVFWRAGGRDFAAAMNAGLFFTVALPGDGGVKVRLRMISSGPLEPHGREFRRIRGATPAAPLLAASGRLRLHGGGSRKIDADAPTDRLAARAFQIGGGRSQEVLILAGPMGRDAPDALFEAPALDIY